MNLLDKLERKFGRYAIHNLMYYIIILYALGYVILKFARPFYYAYLSLDPAAILHGQIWRIVTFIIYPPNTGLFYFLISMYLYYSIGRILEAQWGAFRFNLYFFTGVLLHVVAAYRTLRPRIPELLDALETQTKAQRLFFAALMVTDITALNSVLLVAGEPRFLAKIPFPRLGGGNVFLCKGIMSRKKQLLPLLLEQLSDVLGVR